ncbi:glycoside hydrolase family 43 protein [Deinococcus cellulosilyticus]|uniref:Arabinan endo-1,5-alpha-L-arabinosidase n=1 Tax=Deinococcus cellulosilyticus (strain DSM 18568 / NBRC 106333 / KACC 11606 / 5516J-15) TaxID=1223518 RepID=A0A511N0R6_DEIC1|nr:glycoside hydrolase family 43 protein [Deinococcus cellulosilyticus]GEM46038.1 arabinan endo-1,5-alpha-L-arabinosidase [Deinococcus cellulosilyticus NBRC 106333 = KACC 11606]
MKRMLMTAMALLTLSACAQAENRVKYQNPVLNINFPDPFVLKTDEGYYAYATNGNGKDIQMAFSKDLVNWDVKGDALGGLPFWAQGGLTWAPEVIQNGEKYLMYYTLRDTASNYQCISVAVSDSPAGPFKDDSQKPLICQADEGGSIDASPFRDKDGQLYLYWKNDGNAIGLLTYIYGQKLSADGLSLLEEPVQLLYNRELWEGNLIEAPTMYEKDGYYYLLFSASDFASDLYAVGYAVGKSPLGEFKKFEDNPIVYTVGDVAGPGHQTITFDDAGNPWLVYHAWTAGAIGDDVGKRTMRIDPIEFKDGKVIFKEPTLTEQEGPVIK